LAGRASDGAAQTPETVRIDRTVPEDETGEARRLRAVNL